MYSLSSGLVAIDAAGSLTALNEAAQRILGGPGGDAADWLGRDFRAALAFRPELLGDWLGRDFRAALAFRPELLGLLEDALDGRERPSRAELVLPANGEAPETTVGFTLLAIRDAQAPSCAASPSSSAIWPPTRGTTSGRGCATDLPPWARWRRGWPTSCATRWPEWS
jgi:hypothetical protein